MKLIAFLVVIGAAAIGVHWYREGGVELFSPALFMFGTLIGFLTGEPR